MCYIVFVLDFLDMCSYEFLVPFFGLICVFDGVLPSFVCGWLFRWAVWPSRCESLCLHVFLMCFSGLSSL